MIALLLAGCAAPLLPGEEVLALDVPAVVLEGGPGDRLGASVALGEAGLLASAPGAGEVRAWDLDGGPLWTWSVGRARALPAWWWGEAARVLVPGRGVLERSADGAVREVAPAPSATAAAQCPDGSVALVEGEGERVACGEAGVLRTACGADGTCAVLANGEPVGATSRGSAVAWLEGRACWGVAGLEHEGEPGRVECEDGEVLAEGIAGDHLGVAIAGERAAGVFNDEAVPARARVVSLGSGEIWTVDRGEMSARVALANGAGRVAVGLAGWMGHQADQGAVWLVVPASR